MHESNTPPVAASPVIRATWDWRSNGTRANGSTTGHLRRGAVTQAVVMALVAAILSFIFDHHLFASLILAVAGLILILGLTYPAAYRPIHNFGSWLGRVAGVGLTYLLLVPFFWLFFTPVSMILRAQRRDPLHRSFRDPQWTYWIRRSPREPGENIDKQFLREDKEAREENRPVGSVTGR